MWYHIPMAPHPCLGWALVLSIMGFGTDTLLASVIQLTIIIIVHFTHAACRLWRSYIQIMGSLPIVSFRHFFFFTCSLVRSSSFVALMSHAYA